MVFGVTETVTCKFLSKRYEPLSSYRTLGASPSVLVETEIMKSVSEDIECCCLAGCGACRCWTGGAVRWPVLRWCARVDRRARASWRGAASCQLRTCGGQKETVTSKQRRPIRLSPTHHSPGAHTCSSVTVANGGSRPTHSSVSSRDRQVQPVTAASGTREMKRTISASASS